MDDRTRPPSGPAFTALTLVAFIVGALLLLPGLGTGLCALTLHGGVSQFVPGWFVPTSVALAIIGGPLAAWAFWRMIR